MAQCVLPTELVEAIIGEVGGNDDFATLKQCALVSQEFVHQAQKYLFHTVDLDRRCLRVKYRREQGEFTYSYLSTRPETPSKANNLATSCGLSHRWEHTIYRGS